LHDERTLSFAPSCPVSIFTERQDLTCKTADLRIVRHRLDRVIRMQIVTAAAGARGCGDSPATPRSPMLAERLVTMEPSPPPPPPPSHERRSWVHHAKRRAWQRRPSSESPIYLNSGFVVIALE
jgi:hypothetical protein